LELRVKPAMTFAFFSFETALRVEFLFFHIRNDLLFVSLVSYRYKKPSAFEE
jgi:hypothetical protein